MLGTGKYKTMNDAVSSIKSSECEIVTVAIRRLPTNLENDNSSFLKFLDWNKLWLLPIQPVLKQLKKQFEWLF